ncbi:MAG TPA: hypothetical protein VFH47_00430, partial [Candidatus Thermoplasmatota archaeon]|nr:hypothetical protein [Candidatus Thermoplasmatota archaeon]
PGFLKESLAATEDERAVIVDCPDAPGWLVPFGVVRSWMARHVHHDELEDYIMSLPVYEHLLRIDEEGLSRGGRIPIVGWEPGIPTHAELLPPEFLPDDPTAPPVNRDRGAYREAVADLLEGLRRFHVVEVEVTLAYGGA